MVKHYYTVAQHTFAVGMCDDERGIAMPSYEPFRVAGGDADLLFTLTINDDFYPSAKGEHIGDFECGAADFGVYRLPDGAYQMLISPPGGGYCGLLQASADFGVATIATRGDNSLRTFAVNNALMLMYAFASSGRGTLLVHASVIKHDGRGYLFLGKSGTGKSTHSRMWLNALEGVELMNDDHPIIRIGTDGQAVAFGSPWSGKTKCYKNVEAPIGGIIRISRAQYNKARRLSVIESYASLISSCSGITWEKDLADGKDHSIQGIIAKVPCWVMECLPDNEAAVVCSQSVTQV